MDWYSVPSRNLGRYTQAHDEYPYEEDHIRSQPRPFIVDGGQRKSSIMSYPNADGSNNYILKAERMVEVVLPVVTRQVLVNGKPVKEERFVGPYEDHNTLKENFHNHGNVQDFFNKVQVEASMPSAPILTKPNLPSQNEAHSLPNWGKRAAWTGRDESPTRDHEHFEVNHFPNTTRDGSPPRYNQGPHEVSRPSSDARPNWPNQSDSPPRGVVHSGTKPNWPSRDGSPTRGMVYESHPNSYTRPNWPKSRDDDPPPKSMVHPDLLARQNSGMSRPNWPRKRDHSPPRPTVHPGSTHPDSGTRPNLLSSQNDSPPRPVARRELCPPNPDTKPNWQKSRDDSPPPKSMVHPDLLAQRNSPPSPMVRPGLSHPNPGSRPDSLGRRNDSPHKSVVHPEFSPPNSFARPNRQAHEEDSLIHDGEKGKDRISYSPMHNKLEELNIYDSPKGNSYQQQVKESDKRPNWPNRKGQDSNTGNNMGLTPSKFNGYEKLKPIYAGHIKKGNEEEIPGLDNTKIEEDPYKKPTNNYQYDNPDDGNFNKSSIAPNRYAMMSNPAKPNFNGRWYKQPGPNTLTNATNNVDDLMIRVLEEAKRTRAYPVTSDTPHWSEITPIPPQGKRGTIPPRWNEITHIPPTHPVITHPIIDSTEARRRYAFQPPPMAAGYIGALSAEDAVHKYGGTFIPK